MFNNNTDVKKLKNSNETSFAKWFSSPYALQYFECESEYLKNALRQVSGPRVLQLGELIDMSIIKEIDFPQHVNAGIERLPTDKTNLTIDPAFLPFRDDIFSTVIAPHVLERHELPHQVLREIHRTLIPEGHIVLTGFNPISLLGLQCLFFKSAACPGKYISIKRVIDWLQLLGFEVVASSAYQYSPLIKNKRLRILFNFLNLLGNRWLPMLGGGYMITARKKQAGETMLDSLTFNKSVIKKRRPKLATASSQSNNYKSTSNK